MPHTCLVSYPHFKCHVCHAWSCLVRAQLGFGQRGPKSLCRTGWRGLAQWESMCLRLSPLFAPDQSFSVMHLQVVYGAVFTNRETGKSKGSGWGIWCIYKSCAQAAGSIQRCRQGAICQQRVGLEGCWRAQWPWASGARGARWKTNREREREMTFFAGARAKRNSPEPLSLYGHTLNDTPGCAIESNNSCIWIVLDRKA